MSQDDKEVEGRAKGGHARAEKLSPDERRDIAQKAALVRWNGPQPLPDPNIKRAIYGSPEKLLKIGEAAVECYVLEDGTRVLSGRGMQSAIGLGGEARTHGSKLRALLDQVDLKPFVNSDLAMAMANPVRFVRPGRGGKPAVAFEATLLIDLCEAIIKAREAGALKGNQHLLAVQAQVITLSFAKAGIIAAIDEITGYQEVREKDAIQRIVEKYLTDYAKKWAKVFPDEFWEKMLRAKGHESYIGLPRPSFIGHWVNDVVYSRLAPGVLAKLKEKNPRVNGKGRRYKHTQFLTDDYGAPELRQHLIKAMTVMDVAITTGQDFDFLLQSVMPKYGDTLNLPLVFEGD